MKFQFEGYEYKDDKDYIEIDFDFMEKSEFIRVLEPDLTIPIMIPERFTNFQVDEFKGILEKITRKEEITEEDKYLCKSKVLKPLFEYFRMDREVMEKVDLEMIRGEVYYVEQIDLRIDHRREKWGASVFKNTVRTKPNIYKTKEDAYKGLVRDFIESYNKALAGDYAGYYSSLEPLIFNDKKEIIYYKQEDRDYSFNISKNFIILEYRYDKAMLFEIRKLNLDSLYTPYDFDKKHSYSLYDYFSKKELQEAMEEDEDDGDEEEDE